ncbi:MAG: hypothetical protein AB4041_18525 [Microcystaceae cyanobacterium]
MSQTNDLKPNLKDLDSDDPVTRAECREQAQEIIASPEIELKEREAIADRLLEANQELTAKNVGQEDSY